MYILEQFSVLTLVTIFFLSVSNIYPSTFPSPLLVFQYPTMPHTVLMSLYLVACVSPSFSFAFVPSLTLFNYLIFFSFALLSLCVLIYFSFSFFFLFLSFPFFFSLFLFFFFSFSLFLFLFLSFTSSLSLSVRFLLCFSFSFSLFLCFVFFFPSLSLSLSLSASPLYLSIIAHDLSEYMYRKCWEPPPHQVHQTPFPLPLSPHKGVAFVSGSPREC